MVALGTFAFVLAAVSLALVIGSGAGRFVEPDDPTMFYVGAALFAGFCLIGLLFKVLGTKPDRGEHPWFAPTITVLALAGLVAGVALDISN